MTWPPMPLASPPRRLSLRRVLVWFGVVAMAVVMAGFFLWTSAQRSDLADARDVRREARSSLERGRASARSQDEALSDRRAEVEADGSLAGQISELDEMTLRLATEHAALSRQANARILEDDPGGYNRLIDEMNANIERQNALSAQISALVSELTGRPIASGPEAAFARL